MSSVAAIYAFEPDAKNMERLESVIKTNNLACAKAYQLAVWDNCERLCFSEGGGSGSQIEESGDTVIQADSLDHVLSGMKVTMIKMDIEGAEQKALLGAEKIIKQERPALAICIYHYLNDIVHIPAYLLNQYPDYALYIRHYSDCLYGEAVCYAIPPELLTSNSAEMDTLSLQQSFLGLSGI